MSESKEEMALRIDRWFGALVEWIIRLAELIILTGLIRLATLKTDSIFLRGLGVALFACLAAHAYQPMIKLALVSLPRSGWTRRATIFLVSAFVLWLMVQLYAQLSQTIRLLVVSGAV